MKSTKFFIFLLPLFSLLSCYNNDEVSDFDYQIGDVIPMVSTFNTNTDSVQFFWDNQKTATLYEAPFVYYFPITENVPSGKHNYWIVTHYSYGKNTTATYKSSYTNVNIR